MRILISKDFLKQKLDALLGKCVQSHSIEQQISNNRYISETLHTLLGIKFTPNASGLVNDYILLAHVSGLRLFLSVKEGDLPSLAIEQARNEFASVDEQCLLYNLQGWDQRQFLPILISFQLTQYYKNYLKIKRQSNSDIDLDTIQKVLITDLWTTVNAFRIIDRHFNIHEEKNNDNLQEKVESLICDFINDLNDLTQDTLNKEQLSYEDKFEILFPCGITNQHAIYISFFFNQKHL